jgi:hypothetical protein
MLVFNNYFYQNKKSKLYFRDRVAVLNDFFYKTGGSKPALGRVWTNSLLFNYCSLLTLPIPTHTQ